MVRDILRRYGIERARPRRVGAGNNNEHWFAGRFVLRRYRERRPLDTVVFEHAVLDHLAGLGWPVAAPITTPYGERILELDGRLYALFPRLPGRRGVPERPRDPRALGRLLGQLHADLATCSAEPKALFAPLLDIATTWGTGTHSVEALFESYAVEAREAAAYCLRTLAAVRAEIAATDTSGMRRTLIHADWHAGNLLFRRGEVTGVLDFDFAHPDLRVADLAASALLVDEDAAVRIVEGYREVQDTPVAELALLNLCERARLLGAIAASLSIQARRERAPAGVEVLVEMLQRVEERWPAMRERLGLT